ncbi:MAG: hypothetical protein O3B01_13580 [Planctomycetota bacterium]|nr:hypothetical protein [Planctomycetota bacterium]MDA1139605.1 hypothetical protein [Planctomycetota bacterium]
MNPPEVQKYLELLKHDLKVLRLLTDAAKSSNPPEDVSDWQVTLLFYLACIYVKAAAQLYGERFDDHISLRGWLNREQDMIAMTRDYRKLEEASRDARYEGRLFSPREIEQEQLSRFETVRDHVVDVLRGKGVTRITEIDPRAVLV